MASESYTWSGGIAGSWSDASSWTDVTGGTPGVPASSAPGSNDTVTVNNASSSVLVLTGVGAASSLTFSGGNIDVVGQLTMGSLTSSSSDLTVLTGASLTDAGDFTQTGSRLDLSGGMTVAGNYNVNNYNGSENITGSLSISGNFNANYNGDSINVTGGNVSVAGALNIGSSSNGVQYGNINVNGGSLTVGSVNYFSSPFGNDGVTVQGGGNVNIGAVLIIPSYYAYNSDFYLNSYGGSSVVVSSLASSAAIYNNGNPTLYQAFSLNVDATSSIVVGSAADAVAGDIVIDSGHTITGQISLGAALIRNQGVFNAQGSSNISGAISGSGVINVTKGSQLSLNGDATGSGAINIGDSASLYLNSHYYSGQLGSGDNINGTIYSDIGASEAVSIGSSSSIYLSAYSYYDYTLNQQVSGYNKIDAAITGFGSSDTINVQGTVTSASFVDNGSHTGGVLTLYNGTTAVETLNLVGDYHNATFIAVAAPNGYTQVSATGLTRP